MKFFNTLFKGGKTIIKGGEHLIRTITPEDKKQRDEIKKIEQQLKKLQTQEGKDKNKESNKDKIIVTNRMFLKFRLFGALAVFIGYAVFQSLSIIYLILAAYIVSIAVEAIIDIFEKMKCSRGWSIAFTYFLLVVFLLSGFVLVAPFILNQTSEVINILLVKMNAFQDLLQQQGLAHVLQSSNLLPHYVEKEIFHNFTDPTVVNDLQTKILANINQLENAWANYAQVIGNLAVNFLTSFVSFLAQAGIVITLSVLFSIEKISVMQFIATRGGQKKYKYLYMKLEKIYKKLGIWLKSRLLLSLYIGITMYIGLWIMSALGMDIPNKASIALILGLLDIVPYIGPFVGGIPAVLAGFTMYGWLGGSIMLGIVFVINFIESNVLIPVLMNKSLGINTIVIFISMILGGIIMGFVGILLAVPIAAIITLLFEKDLVRSEHHDL